MIISNFYVVFLSDISSFSPKFFKRKTYFHWRNSNKLKALRFNTKRLHMNLKLSDCNLYLMNFFIYVILESKI